jgi:hypothetical protein
MIDRQKTIEICDNIDDISIIGLIYKQLPKYYKSNIMDNVKYIIIETDDIMKSNINIILSKFIHIKNNKTLTNMSSDNYCYMFQIISNVIFIDIITLYYDIIDDPEWSELYHVEIIKSSIGKILHVYFK